MAMSKGVAAHQKWYKRAIVGIGLGTAASLVLAGCGAGGGSADNGDDTEVGTIVYSVITPLTGPAAAWGPPEQASAEKAADDINKAGGVTIAGKKYNFEVKTYDSAFDTAKTVTETRKALTQDNSQFLEILGGDLIPPVQPVVGDKALIFVVGDGQEFLGSSHPTTFRLWNDVPETAERLLTYLKPKIENDEPKLVAIYPQGKRGEDLTASTLKRAEGIGFTGARFFSDPKAGEYTALMTKALAENPDVIDFGYSSASVYATMVKEARQLGYTGRFIFPDTVVASVINETAGKGAAEGSAAGPVYVFDSEKGKEWVDYVTKESGPLQSWAALSYENLYLLKAALEKAGTTDPMKVADTLKSLSVPSQLIGGNAEYAEVPGTDGGYAISGFDSFIGVINKDGELEVVKDEN